MGVVGLGVMGANLARNIESRGFPVVGYDLDAAKAQAFVNGPAKGKAVGRRRQPDEPDGDARAAAAHSRRWCRPARPSTASSRT